MSYSQQIFPTETQRVINDLRAELAEANARFLSMKKMIESLRETNPETGFDSPVKGCIHDAIHAGSVARKELRDSMELENLGRKYERYGKMKHQDEETDEDVILEILFMGAEDGYLFLSLNTTTNGVNKSVDCLKIQKLENGKFTVCDHLFEKGNGTINNSPLEAVRSHLNIF